MSASGPPEDLVRSLLADFPPLRGLEWHDEVASTNARAAQLAEQDVAEMHAVLADRQTAGRGRLGRTWEAPAGTSLLCSLLLRPAVRAEALALLPLLVGLTLTEAVEPHVGGAAVTLKWPNDLLVDGRKAAGILVEAVGTPPAVVAGTGVNVDWRGVSRPPELRTATSLAEVAGRDVDRWAVFAGFVGCFSRRYPRWQASPEGFLDDYRRRCTTIGRRVRVTRSHAEALEGEAVEVGGDGTLAIRLLDGRVVRLATGDVEHLRPA